MEATFRRKAIAVLAALLLVFGGYCYFLVTVVPRSEAVVFTVIYSGNSALDSWNFTELKSMYYQPAILMNYSVNPSPIDFDNLEIVPKNNSNVMIHLSQYDGEGFYFFAEGYMMVGAFGATGDWVELENEITYHLTIILGHIGHPELAQRLFWDDNDFAAYLSVFHIFGFFGFTALIIMFVFMVVFRKGWLLVNIKLIDRNVPIFFGTCALYLSFGFGLFCAWVTATGVGPDERLVCWAVPAVFFTTGLYLLIAEMKTIA